MSKKRFLRRLKSLFNTDDDKLGKRLLNSTIKSALYGFLCYLAITSITKIIFILNTKFQNSNPAITFMNDISTWISVGGGLFTILIQLLHMIIKESFNLYNLSKTTYFIEGLPGKAGEIASEADRKINSFKPGEKR